MNLRKYELAIIMSVYKKDRLNWLKECIKSIELKKNLNYCLLIYIDGSISNKINNYLKKIFSENKNIYLYKNKNNKGLYFALNHLIKSLRKFKYSGYVARLDADDVVIKDRFKKQINFLRKNKSIDVLGSNALLIDESSKIIGKISKPQKHKYLLQRMPYSSPFIHPTVMFNKGIVLNKNVKYKNTVARYEDFILWTELMRKKYKFHNLNQYLIKYRLTQLTASRRVNFNKILNEFKYKLRFLKYDKKFTIPFFKFIFISLIKLLLPAKILIKFRLIFHRI